MQFKKSQKAFILCLAIIIFIGATHLLISYGQNHKGTPPEQTLQPETTEDNRPTVIIDAGHGGEDGGTSGKDGTREKDINLAIALELEQILRSNGYKTRLTRSEDILLYDRNSDYHGHKKQQDMAARLAICNEYDNAIFISIHMNWFSQSKYSGLQVYYSENNVQSAQLASSIQTLCATHLQPDNTRKIKPSGGNIYLLEKINHPAVLVECGFLSNTEDCANLNDKEYRTRLCTVIYYAVCEQISS